MATDNQVCAFRELVMAHHAYERALLEFANTGGIVLTSSTQAALREVCRETDPRSVDADAAAEAINFAQEAA